MSSSEEQFEKNLNQLKNPAAKQPSTSTDFEVSVDLNNPMHQVLNYQELQRELKHEQDQRAFNSRQFHSNVLNLIDTCL